VQSVGHRGNAVGIPQPLTRSIRIGTLPAECFLSLTSLGDDERAIRVLILHALDHKHKDARRVVIFKLRGHDLARLARAILTAGLGWWVPVDRFARTDKVKTVDVLHQVDDIAAFATPAAVPELLGDVDGEPVYAAALRAWADEFIAFTLETESASSCFVFEPRATGALHPLLESGASAGHVAVHLKKFALPSPSAAASASGSSGRAISLPHTVQPSTG
jgi:hypothetical protein